MGRRLAGSGRIRVIVAFRGAESSLSRGCRSGSWAENLDSRYGHLHMSKSRGGHGAVKLARGGHCAIPEVPAIRLRADRGEEEWRAGWRFSGGRPALQAALSGFLEVSAERVAIAGVELIHREPVVLGSVRGNLDCAHERGDPPGGLPVEVVCQAE